MRQYGTWIILFLVFSSGSPTTCPSPDKEINIVSREQYYGTNIDNIEIYKILYDSAESWYY